MAPLGQLAYRMTAQLAPEIAAQPPPKVIWWFKVYCGFLCFLYLAPIAYSVFLLLADPQITEISATTALITGALLPVGSLALLIACLLPLVLRPDLGFGPTILSLSALA